MYYIQQRFMICIIKNTHETVWQKVLLCLTIKYVFVISHRFHNNIKFTLIIPKNWLNVMFIEDIFPFKTFLFAQ